MSDRTSRPICPICQQTLSIDAAAAKQLFCSKRCQMIDLGGWLSERYRVPVSHEEEDHVSED